MTDSERRQEQLHLEQVEAVIEENLGKLYELREELRGKVVGARQEMWEHGPHLIRTFDDVVQLAVQGETVDSAEDQYARNQLEIERHLKMRAAPFFGRLDYREGGRDRTVYIGIYGLRGQGSRRMLVVDWRAPVSSMFYGFDVGPGWFDTPNGRRDVDITLKRQYRIEDGQLRLMYDTDSAMYDDILAEVLSQNTDHSLKVIIGSIQKEQDAAIRSDPRHSLLISGLAGSGKTSVGLHRLAYILYHQRECMKAEDILIISGNAIFGSYVSTILPDLGERPAGSLVFQDLLLDMVGHDYDVEGWYRHLKAAGSDPARAQVMGVKYSPAFLRRCAEHFARFPYRMPDIRWRGELIMDQAGFGERWEKMRYSSFQSSFELVKRLVREGIEEYFRANEEAILAAIEEEEREPLSGRELRALFRQARGQLIADAMDGISRLNRLDPKLQAVDLLRAHLEAAGQDSYPATELFKAFQGDSLRYEDALLLLYVRLLMGQAPVRPDIQHVVIDEAQDYSPLQLSILRLMYPKSAFTILADVFQAVDTVTTTRDYDWLRTCFGEQGQSGEAVLRQMRLAKCYRSSSEINALAFQLLSREAPEAAREYSYFERSTMKPRCIIGEPLERLRDVLDGLGRYNSVAVIACDEGQAAKIGEYLGDAAQTLLAPEGKLEGRVKVLPLLLAKGLEFDAVVLVDAVAGRKGDPDLRRKLYLSCTRALHELWLLESEALPGELGDCLEYLEVDG